MLYSGQGKVYVGERDAAGRPKGLTWLGNVPVLELSIEVTKFEHKESYSGQRAVDLTIIQEKKGTFSMDVEELSLFNLALGFWGQSATVASATDVTKLIYASLDKPSPIDGYIGLSNIVVKDETGVTTYVLDTDYTLDSNNNVTPLSTGSIVDDSLMQITFDHSGFAKMDALTQTSIERFLRFEGLNTVDGSSVLIDIFKASLDPLTGLGLINEEVGSMTLTGNILYDDLQAGNSKYFRQVQLS